MKRELSRFGKKVRCLVVLNGERLKDLRRQYRKLERERATYVRYMKGSD